MSRIDIHKLTKRWSDEPAVDAVSFTVPEGSLTVLLGPSGCGKSTILRLIAGLETTTSGAIAIGGKDVTHMDPAARGVSMVFQSYALFPHLTVRENILFGLKVRGIAKDDRRARLEKAARMVGLADLLNRKPSQLSGGQRQRVALARSIVSRRPVCLMDEPLSNLDAKLRVQMRTEITKLHNRLQTTFIYVTHDQTEAMTMGTRIVVLKDGFIQQVDSPQNLYDYPVNLFVAGFIGSPPMNFIDAKLIQDGSAVYAVFGDQKVKVPDGKVKKLIDPSYIGKEVVLGIRPEDMHDEDIFLQSAVDSTVKVYVEVVEQMGSETYLHLNVNDSPMTARVDPRSTARTGDTIKIALDPNKLMFFDKDTEECILKR